MDHESLARRCCEAAPQGLASTGRLHEAGLDDAAIRRLVRAGTLERVTVGWFALAGQDIGAGQWLARLGTALEQRYCGRVVASHHTALAMLGLPLFDVPTGMAHLTYRAAGKYRRRGDHVVHAAPRGVQLPRVGAVPVAEAVTATGIAFGVRAYVVAGDAALARGLVSTTDLKYSLVARAYAPGGPAAVRGLRLLDGRSESPGESLLRLAIVELGLPHPVASQVEVTANGCRYRLDLALEETRVGIEFDGMGKYADPRAIRAEKLREEHLRLEGWILVRFQWTDLFTEGVIRERLHWALGVDQRRRLAG